MTYLKIVYHFNFSVKCLLRINRYCSYDVRVAREPDSVGERADIAGGEDDADIAGGRVQQGRDSHRTGKGMKRDVI